MAEWTPADPRQALQDILRRFLTTYGPATMEEFGRWWGIDVAKAKRLFRTLDKDEVTEVNVEGWHAHVLTSTLQAFTTATPTTVVRLLPYFDPYTIAVARHANYLMDETHKARVYRSQGWISPVVTVGGRIVGVWDFDKKAKQTTLSIDLFEKPDDHLASGIAEEAERLTKFWGTEQ